MTVGKDVSALFPDVVNCMQTDNLELKKLVYLYLMNYAKSQPDMAIMAVNTFVKVRRPRLFFFGFPFDDVWRWSSLFYRQMSLVVYFAPNPRSNLLHIFFFIYFAPHCSKQFLPHSESLSSLHQMKFSLCLAQTNKPIPLFAIIKSSGLHKNSINLILNSKRRFCFCFFVFSLLYCFWDVFANKHVTLASCWLQLIEISVYSWNHNKLN